MKKFKNIRTVTFIAWILIVAVVLFIMPNLDELVREKGQLEVPSSAESEKASKLLNEMKSGGEKAYDFVIVFHDEDGLSSSQVEKIDAVIENYDQHKEQYGITKLLAHTQSEQAAKQLVSEDGTTILTQISINENIGQIHEISANIYEDVSIKDVDTYVTGAAMVTEDFSTSTQEGVKKTEIIAVIFIILVLLLIFRSPIIPVISLISVGVSYLVSLGIIALLVEHFDLPFSNFTQVFLVVILFGVGTDYNILLFTRFKEELATTGDVLKAISNTYWTAGKTVIFSGVAVLIGFIALFLAQFKMYLATAPVAIGVAILLLVLLTLNPFFMAALGNKLFWPKKSIEGHSENRFWEVLSKNAYMRPLLSILLIACLLVPSILSYSGKLNFNDLNEIDDKYLSKQAISIIEDHYLAGFSSPINFVIQSSDTLATQGNLKTLDDLAEKIEQVDGVAKVYSVTRPEAKRINDLYIKNQSNTLNSGLTEAEEGIGQISEGLGEATEELNKPQDLSAVQTLIDGTSQLEDGASKLQDALKSLNTGILDGASGAEQIRQGLASLNENLTPLVQGVQDLQSAYTNLENGFSQFSSYITGSQTMISQSKAAFTQIQSSLESAISSNPDLDKNENIQTALQVTKQVLANIAPLEAQAEQVTTKYNQALQGFNTANDSLANVTNGLTQVQNGVIALETGAEQLASGLTTAADGSTTIANESSQITSGLSKVNDGQKELQTSLLTLQQQMAQLSSGLIAGSEGLSQIYDGLEEANRYLDELSNANTGTFYIPQAVIDSEDFEESLNQYMSTNRQISSMMIILDVNPYTAEAMEIGEDIRSTVDATLKGSPLENAKAYVGGKTMSNIDLQQIAHEDFIRSAIAMLIGIAIVLLIITRSLYQTFVTIASLVMTTFAALGIAEIINRTIVGQEFISWNVPFFSFIMIIALGVDYSIFLLMRFNENPELGTAGIIPAARQMGGVIISAAIILGGTFAALIPSGILSLIQVALVVIIGLILLSCIMMPAFLPAMLGLREKILNFTWKKPKPPIE